MVKKLKYNVLYAFLTAICFLSACQKAPMNNGLDGRWQILEIEINGETINAKDDQLYYNLYNTVCSLSYYGGHFSDGKMKFENSELYLFFPNINTPVKLERLEDFGIYSNPVTFKVEYLDSKKLILKEGDEIITLRKF